MEYMVGIESEDDSLEGQIIDEPTFETVSRAKNLYRTSAQRQSVDILQGHVGQVQGNGTVFDPHHRA